MKLDPVLFGGTERHSFGEITFECLGGGLVGHFPSAARSSLRQGRGPQRRARLASRLFTSSFPRGRARRRCSLGARRLPYSGLATRRQEKPIRVLRALAGSF